MGIGHAGKQLVVNIFIVDIIFGGITIFYPGVGPIKKNIVIEANNFSYLLVGRQSMF